MIKEIVQGNIFDSTCQAITNTVNCVGVMGAGLALQFARKFPDYVAAYKFMTLQPGDVWYYTTTKERRNIISIATKDHWKNPSKLEWIDEALKQLNGLVERKKLKSIALPKLGCGLGGLDWHAVYPKIKEFATKHPDLLIEVYV